MDILFSIRIIVIWKKVLRSRSYKFEPTIAFESNSSNKRNSYSEYDDFTITQNDGEIYESISPPMEGKIPQSPRFVNEENPYVDENQYFILANDHEETVKRNLFQ